MPTDNRAKVDAYLKAFAGLTDDKVEDLVALCTPDVHFTDPFNDVRGQAALAGLFHHMFENATEPRFAIEWCAGSSNRYVAKWQFSAGLPVIGQVSTPGLSEITLAENGLVAEHIDYWDSGQAIYARVPVLGPLIRNLRKRMSASA